MAYPSSELPRITFRLPEKLRQRLEDAAAANSRSITAEIVARLDLSFMHEIEGRQGDAASLRNEVYELRQGLLTMIGAIAYDDQKAFSATAKELLKELKAD